MLKLVPHGVVTLALVAGLVLLAKWIAPEPGSHCTNAAAFSAVAQQPAFYVPEQTPQDQLQRASEYLRDAGSAWRGSAPAELRDEVSVVVDAYDRKVDLFESVGIDGSRLSFDQLGQNAGLPVEAYEAGEQLEGAVAQDCGLRLSFFPGDSSLP